MDWLKAGTRLLRAAGPERAHRLTLAALKAGLVPRPRQPVAPSLETRLWGLDFPTPLGLAAGFDKNAEVPARMLAQGFAFVECGSVTPRPQPGNPRPRLFRLAEDGAVINRLGFNNEGIEAFRDRLAAFRSRAPDAGIVGANLGANRDSDDPAQDYVTALESLQGLADFFVVNVSSPNTPGLRALQGRDALADLVGRLLEARERLSLATPLLVKVAPDLGDAGKRAIAEVAVSAKIDGLVVSNTTIGHRDGLRSSHRDEAGGLSGRPLFGPSTRLLAEFRLLTEGRLVLVGAGGVDSAETAYAKIRAGASLVELYTALIYEGPRLATRITRGLAALVTADGYANVSEAVGRDAVRIASGRGI